MQRFLLRSIGAIASLVMASGAWSATVNVQANCDADGDGSVGEDGVQDCAVSILGLNVEGVSYNVEFVYDQYLNLGANELLFVGNQAGAEIARDALIEALNLSTASSAFDLGSPASPIFYVPFNSDVDTAIGESNSYAPGGWVTNSGDELSSGKFLNYVSFTAVPVPPTVWLFGSALGLLGWVRRRTA